MDYSTEFFGREKELEYVDSLFTIQLFPRLLLISGPGGIGKTTLLNELHKRIIKSHLHFQVIPVFDLADPMRQSVIAILNEIAFSFSSDFFERYFLDLRDFNLMPINTSMDVISFRRNRLKDTYVTCYNNLTHKKQTAILIDSAEYLKSNDDWVDLLKIMSQFENTIVIIAGRPEGINLVEQESLSCFANIDRLDLSPFELKEASSILEDSEQTLLSESLQIKLQYLTGGMPLLLVLAAYRLSRGLNLPDLIKKTEEEIRLESEKDIKEQFEASLVDFLLQPKDEIDKIVRWMAHFDKRFNAAILSHLTGYSKDKCDELINQLAQIPYVKDRGQNFLLHEDIAELIRKHVWKLIDPFGEQRQVLSKRINDYYDSEISNLEIEIKQNYAKNRNIEQRQSALIDWSLSFQYAEQLRSYKYERIAYKFDYDIDDALREFEQVYDENRNELDFRGSLLNLVDKNYTNLNTHQKFSVVLRRARLARDIRNFTQSYEELDKWEAKSFEMTASQKIELLGLKADLERLNGKPTDALALQEEAIKLADREVPQILPMLIQTKGLMMRNLGRLDIAAKLYEEAINLMPHETDEQKSQRADTMNNLAFVEGLRGNWVNGLAWCEHALKTKIRLGDPSDIAATNIVKGSLLWAKGDYISARKEYDLALSLSQNELIQARAYFSHGIADWFAKEFEKAEEHFERAISIIRKNNFVTELPLAVHDLGHVKWELGNIEATERLFLEGYRLSKLYSDYYTLADSLVGLAELYSVLNKFDKVNHYYREMERLVDDGYTFPLFEGRIQRVLGDIDFSNEDYKRAGARYAKGIAILAQHGGYGKYSTEEELLRIDKKMDKITQDLKLEWCNLLEHYASNMKLGEKRNVIDSFIKIHRILVD